MVRIKLGLTQQQISERLTTKRSPVYPGHISEFEQGKREPSLIVLLRYARVANATADELIYDELDLAE